MRILTHFLRALNYMQASAGLTQQASMGGKPMGIHRPSQRNARLQKLVSGGPPTH
jgi:hypothetical protein